MESQTGTKALSDGALLEMSVAPLKGGYNYEGCSYRVRRSDGTYNGMYRIHLCSQELLKGHRLLTSITDLGRSFPFPSDFIKFCELLFSLDATTKSITLVASSRSQQETYDLLSNVELLKGLKKAGYPIYKKKSTRNSHQTAGYKLFWLTVKREK